MFVRDNGMGIEPSMVDRIFLPFFRLVMRNVPGAGIGLSIVKTIVEQYEGSVSLDSTPGMGSTFCVYLPVISWNPSLLPQAPLQAIVSVSGNGLASDRPHRLVGKEESSE